MKPLIHAENSVRKWGGKTEDYQGIHDFLDSSKAHFPDMRHRALLHNSFGIYIAERIFGTYIVNSAGKKISVRDIAEEHVIEDMGTIPTVQDYLQHLPMLPWLGGKKREKRKITWDQFDTQHKAAEPSPELVGPILGPLADPNAVFDRLVKQPELGPAETERISKILEKAATEKTLRHTPESFRPRRINLGPRSNQNLID